MSDAAADQHSHQEIEATLRALVAARAPDRTICPSQVARKLAGEAGDWRALMPAVHEAAERLAAAGDVTLLQGGRPVGGGRPRGAYRITGV